MRMGQIEWNGQFRSAAVQPRKVVHPAFFETFPFGPIHSVLDQNFRKFWLNGTRPEFRVVQFGPLPLRDVTKQIEIPASR